jgi:hypothetical protein
MRWLRDTLNSALNDTVLLLTHTAPGAGEATDAFNARMLHIASEHGPRMIKLSGHGHTDSFYVELHPLTGVPVGHGWIAPSLMPNHRDPCFRVYHFGDDGRLLDYDQYRLNLEAQIAKNNSQSVEFELEYSALTEYNLKDMSLASWVNLGLRFAVDPFLFRRYIEHYNPGPFCDEVCRRRIWCDIFYIDRMRNEMCMKYAPELKMPSVSV